MYVRAGKPGDPEVKEGGVPDGIWGGPGYTYVGVLVAGGPDDEDDGALVQQEDSVIGSRSTEAIYMLPSLVKEMTNQVVYISPSLAMMQGTCLL